MSPHENVFMRIFVNDEVDYGHIAMFEIILNFWKCCTLTVHCFVACCEITIKEPLGGLMGPSHVLKALIRASEKFLFPADENFLL